MKTLLEYMLTTAFTGPGQYADAGLMIPSDAEILRFGVKSDSPDNSGIVIAWILADIQKSTEQRLFKVMTAGFSGQFVLEENFEFLFSFEHKVKSSSIPEDQRIPLSYFIFEKQRYGP